MLDSVETLEKTVEKLLTCPRCHSSLTAKEGKGRITCHTCGFEGAIQDGVVLMAERSRVSSFDAIYQDMEQSNEDPGTRSLFYEQQAKLAEQYLRPGKVVLDVGCGSRLPYQKRSDCFLIGLEASCDSIRANGAVDLKIYGTASALPLPPKSVDVILCFYSIHHMVGQTVAENNKIISQVFAEFDRVIKPGGDLLIFEVNPWLPFEALQHLTWNAVRRQLGSSFDMYFRSAGSLATLGQSVLPQTAFKKVAFKTPLLTLFPPVFRKPSLKVPRFLYPFELNLYHWHF